MHRAQARRKIPEINEIRRWEVCIWLKKRAQQQKIRFESHHSALTKWERMLQMVFLSRRERRHERWRGGVLLTIIILFEYLYSTTTITSFQRRTGIPVKGFNSHKGGDLISKSNRNISFTHAIPPEEFRISHFVEKLCYIPVWSHILMLILHFYLLP